MANHASPRALILVMAFFLLGGCGDGARQAAYQPEYGQQPASTATHKDYRFAVHPLHNPEKLFAVYGPIVDRLNAAIPEARFTLEASRNYEEFDKKLYGRQFDLALPNPYQTVNALRHGYRVFGKMGDDDQFRGIFLVRRDSPVREVADLKGKVVSFPAKTALAAAMLPQQFLHDNGLPMAAYEARYVGSQESSIMTSTWATRRRAPPGRRPGSPSRRIIPSGPRGWRCAGVPNRCPTTVWWRATISRPNYWPRSPPSCSACI